MKQCRQWEASDDDYLRANYATEKLGVMSKRLDRTIAALKRRAQYLGVRRPHRGTKGMKFPNRKRNTETAAENRLLSFRFEDKTCAHLYSVCANWAR